MEMKLATNGIRGARAAALCIVGIAMLSTTPSVLAKDGDVRLRCSASQRRGPEMGADFRSRDQGIRTRFSVEVADLADTSGLSVEVAGFTAAIPEEVVPTGGRANGVADLNLDSQDGEFVPVLTVGDLVSVSQHGVGILACYLR